MRPGQSVLQISVILCTFSVYDYYLLLFCCYFFFFVSCWCCLAQLHRQIKAKFFTKYEQKNRTECDYAWNNARERPKNKIIFGLIFFCFFQVAFFLPFGSRMRIRILSVAAVYGLLTIEPNTHAFTNDSQWWYKRANVEIRTLC